MSRNQQPASAGMPVVICLIFLTAIAMKDGLISNPQWYKLAWISVPLLVVSLIVLRMRKPAPEKDSDIGLKKQ